MQPETERMEIRAELRDYGRYISLWMLPRNLRGVMQIITSMTYETFDESKLYDPSCKLSKDMAQQLVDDLWRAGIRPTEGAGSSGSMAAVTNHLADLRRLVFDHHVVRKP